MLIGMGATATCDPSKNAVIIIVVIIIKWFVSHVKSFLRKESQVWNSHVPLLESLTVQFSFKPRLERTKDDSKIRDKSLWQAVPENWCRMLKGTVSN